jgi:hypothetical protein
MRGNSVFSHLMMPHDHALRAHRKWKHGRVLGPATALAWPEGCSALRKGAWVRG